MAPVHERMPVILAKGTEQAWLCEKDLDKTLSYLTPFDSSAMKAYPIRTLVNSPVNDSVDLFKPLVQSELYKVK